MVWKHRAGKPHLALRSQKREGRKGDEQASGHLPSLSWLPALPFAWAGRYLGPEDTGRTWTAASQSPLSHWKKHFWAVSQAHGVEIVFGETPQRHPRRCHHPSPMGEYLLGRSGFIKIPGSILQVLGKGCFYEVFTGLGKRRERGVNSKSDGLQLSRAPVPTRPCPDLSPAPRRCPMPGAGAALLPGWECVQWPGFLLSPQLPQLPRLPANSFLAPFTERERSENTDV